IVGVRAAEMIGVVNDGEYKVSGRDEQAAFTRFTEPIKQNRSTLVSNGSNDIAMVKMRKEANAQGVDTVKVWNCGLSCYTPQFLEAGGADVEGTYVWIQFLPFEEADTNAELKAYIDAIGGVEKATSWGAAAWAGGVEFKQVIDKIVEEDGPNAITRARFLEELAALDNFDANGWFGKKTKQRSLSECFVMLQVQNGEFVRVFPEERGTFHCAPENLQEISVDPTTEFRD
ncbi:MAG TPA: ABC transporter substrate-binding protein, partial [Acidimicrobiales bacterium]